MKVFYRLLQIETPRLKKPRILSNILPIIFNFKLKSAEAKKFQPSVWLFSRSASWWIGFSRRRNKLTLLLFFSVISFIFLLPIFQNFNNWGIHDWDYDFVMHAVPRETILKYHQIPLWNPWHSGGTVLLANPQSKFLSPFYIFVLLFGVVHGIKIEIWVNFVIGLFGTYFLARYYKLNKLSAIFSAVVFMLSSLYSLSITVGMTTFMMMVFIPWLFLYYLKSFSNLKYTLTSSLFFLLMLFRGGVHLLAVSLFFIAFHSLLLILLKKQPFIKTLKVLFSILLLLFSLGAVKLIPALEFLSQFPRPAIEWSGFSLESIRHGLFSRDQSLVSIKKFAEGGNLFFGANYGMAENGMYIGLIPFLLFIIGAVFYGKKQLILLFDLVTLLWICFGNRILISLWEIIHLFPIYSSYRTPQRFRFAFLLCLAIFGGFGFQKINQSLKKKKIVNLLFFFILALVIFDLTLVSRPVLMSGFTIPPLKLTRAGEFRQIKRLPSFGKSGWNDKSDMIFRAWSALYPAFLSNSGTIEPYEPIPLPNNPTPIQSKDYKGEVYLEGTEGKAYFSKWSPNKLTIRLNVQNKGYLIINQNYYSGWKAKGKKEMKVESINGLLGVKITPGIKEVTFYYLPKSFLIGLSITSITVLIIAFFGLRKRLGFYPKSSRLV